MGIVIPFTLRSNKQSNQVMCMDEIFTDHATAHIDRSKYWSHVCPRIGMYTMSNEKDCRFCGATKQEGEKS